MEIDCSGKTQKTAALDSIGESKYNLYWYGIWLNGGRSIHLSAFPQFCVYCGIL
jgi:hypothetical protein